MVKKRVEWSAFYYLIDEEAPFRPWPDDAHFSFKHIVELRKLVEPVFPHYLSRLRHSRIIIAAELRSVGFSVRTHGSEFDDLKRPLLVSDAFLTIEHRALGIELDPNGERQEKWAQQ